MQVQAFTFEPEWLGRFLEFPERLYAGDLRWVAPSRAGLSRSLSQENPFFRHGNLRHFLVLRDGEVAGRVTAIVNDWLQATDLKAGLVGFFECVEDQAVADALLTQAHDWLAQQRAEVLRGPMNFDTWHAYRFMIKGFDEEPILMEPYNKPYYPALFERWGFSIASRYVSKAIDDPDAILERLMPKYERCVAAGYRLRTLEMRRFQEELQLLYRLSCEIFAGNWGYAPITEAEFLALYDGVGPLIDPALVFFAYGPNGEPAGFHFSTPNWVEPVRRMRGRADCWAKTRFVLARMRRPDVVNLKSMGVVPAHRRSALGAALVCATYRALARRGYRRTNHCLIREGNFSSGYDGGAGRVHKEYAVYEARVGRG